MGEAEGGSSGEPMLVIWVPGFRGSSAGDCVVTSFIHLLMYTGGIYGAPTVCVRHWGSHLR